jgi:hypothetical protein
MVASGASRIVPSVPFKSKWCALRAGNSGEGSTDALMDPIKIVVGRLVTARSSDGFEPHPDEPSRFQFGYEEAAAI